MYADYAKRAAGGDDYGAAKRARLTTWDDSSARAAAMRASQLSVSMGNFDHGATGNLPQSGGGGGGIISASTMALLRSASGVSSAPGASASTGIGVNQSGDNRANRPTVVTLQVRPVRMPGSNKLVVPAFRVGDVAFLANPHLDEEAHAVGVRAHSTVVTLLTINQVREIEANHRHFAGTVLPAKATGVRRGAGGVGAADHDGNPVEGADAAAVDSFERPGIFERFVPAGVVAATFMSDRGTPLVSLCVAGTIYVNNVWGPDLSRLMHLYFRELTIQPPVEGAAAPTLQQKLRRKVDTVRTVVPWPPKHVLNDYYEDTQAAAEASVARDPYAMQLRSRVSVEHVGPWEVIGRTTTTPDVGSDMAYYGPELRLFGQVTDVLPSGAVGRGEYEGMDETATSGAFGGELDAALNVAGALNDPRSTTPYYGKIEVDVALQVGMDVHIAAAGLSGVLVEQDMERLALGASDDDDYDDDAVYY